MWTAVALHRFGFGGGGKDGGGCSGVGGRRRREGKRQRAAAVQRACGVRWPSTALDSAGAGGTGVGVSGWGAKEARRKAALGREPAVATLAWLCLRFPGLLTAQEVVEIIPITRVRAHYFIPAEDGNGKSCGVQLHGTWPVYKNYTNLSSYIVCVGRSEPGWRPSPRCCASSGATASPERNTQRPSPAQRRRGCRRATTSTNTFGMHRSGRTKLPVLTSVRGLPYWTPSRP
jgi:hypothetical protein